LLDEIFCLLSIIHLLRVKNLHSDHYNRTSCYIW
jgi:hypothetical protein